VPKPPTVASGNGASFLAYEVHVTNFAAQTMTLKRVDVAAASGNDERRVLLTLADSALLRSLTRPGTQPPLAERAKLAGGVRAVEWLWVPVDRQAPPVSVQTRVILEQGTGDSARTQELDGPAVPVAAEAQPIGRDAFYAHLQPGSLRVKRGDKVRTGQVVGLVGNSGNSTEPHLHFHLSDGNSPLGSEGIPYIHGSFELVGRCTRFGSGCERSAPAPLQRELPMANMLVRFPQ